MQYDKSYIRRLISRVQWTWAKTYQSVPHEYIVRKRCGLTDKEFSYQNYSLVELFPDAFFLPVGYYRIVSSRPISDLNRPKDAIPEAVISEAFKHGVPADCLHYLRETDCGSLYTDHVSPPTSDGIPLPTGCPIFFYYKDGKVEVDSIF